MGIAENVPVKIQNFFIPVDFVILDMEVDVKMPLILGRSFLSTTNAHVDVGAGEIQLNINGQTEVRLPTEGRTMFPGQSIQPEEIRERAGEAINTHNRYPCRALGTTKNRQGNQSA